jgi:hypothetical protein
LWALKATSPQALQDIVCNGNRHTAEAAETQHSIAENLSRDTQLSHHHNHKLCQWCGRQHEVQHSIAEDMRSDDLQQTNGMQEHNSKQPSPPAAQLKVADCNTKRQSKQSGEAETHTQQQLRSNPNI